MERMQDPECISCQFLAGELVAPGGLIFKGDHWTLNHHATPQGKTWIRGHLVLCSNVHVTKFQELSLAAATEYGQLLRMADRALHRAMRPESVYHFSIGAKVPHVHTHIIPHYEGMSSGVELLAGLVRGDHECAPGDAENAAAEIRRRFSEVM